MSRKQEYSNCKASKVSGNIYLMVNVHTTGRAALMLDQLLVSFHGSYCWPQAAHFPVKSQSIYFRIPVNFY